MEPETNAGGRDEQVTEHILIPNAADIRSH
jgi:hypothetical protein